MSRILLVGKHGGIFCVSIALFMVVFLLGLYRASADVASRADEEMGRTITFQGYLVEGDVPATGTRLLGFRLWRDASSPASSAVLWPSSGVATKTVNLTAGRFSVELGGEGMESLPESTFGHGEVWLEVVVDGEALAGRQRIGTARHATFTPVEDAVFVSCSLANNYDWRLGATRALPLVDCEQSQGIDVDAYLDVDASDGQFFRFTAPSDGLYRVDLGMSVSAGSTSDRLFLRLGIAVNTPDNNLCESIAEERRTLQAEEAVSVHVSRIFRLTEGDTLTPCASTSQYDSGLATSFRGDGTVIVQKLE